MTDITCSIIYQIYNSLIHLLAFGATVGLVTLAILMDQKNCINLPFNTTKIIGNTQGTGLANSN